MKNKDWDNEMKAWFCFYRTYNDDNLRHAQQAFTSKHFMTAEELFEENITWVKQIFDQMPETEANIKALKDKIPGGAEYYREYYERKWAKARKCRYFHPSFDGAHNCVFGAKTFGEYSEYARAIKPAECEKCPRYKSRYIEYPLVINGIEYGDASPWNIKPCLASVRPCDDENTYLGLYLGEMPRMPYSTFNEESGTLKFSMTCNPCLYVPKLGKVVWGDESWWSRIESDEELREITDEDINGQFYVRMLEALLKRGEENEEGKN